jgi:hypothetical protein
MERSWLDTVQLLGLDVMVAVIVLMLLAQAIWPLGVTLGHVLARVLRHRRRVLPTSPRDAYPTQEWGPSR